jgi:hypothetical protein
MNALRKYDILNKGNNDCDPFEFATVKGLTMNHERDLDDTISYLIQSYGIQSCDSIEIDLDLIPQEDQDELLRFYIESIAREIEWACYGADESIDSDFLCSMLAMLQDNNSETREQFAVTTRKNLFIYYKETLENLLDIGCDVYFKNQMLESGYSAQIDNDHGDVVWGKF